MSRGAVGRAARRGVAAGRGSAPPPGRRRRGWVRWPRCWRRRYTGVRPGGRPPRTRRPLSDAAEQGKALYETSCITCHGRNRQGVEGRGPSLIGVGSAAVEFQVAPAGCRWRARRRRRSASRRSSPTRRPARQIGAYIQELGGGPQLPDADRRGATATSPSGGELFRINCSSCHFFGGGGALSSGKYAPRWTNATDRDIYAAMLTGPQNMPVFGDNQLTPEEKRAIIAYIQTCRGEGRPGRLGHRPARPGARGPGDLPRGHGGAGLRDAVDCGEVMTVRHRPSTGQRGRRRRRRPAAVPVRPGPEGARRDGVEIVHYAPRSPGPELARRSGRRAIAFLFLLRPAARPRSWWPTSGGRGSTSGGLDRALHAGARLTLGLSLFGSAGGIVLGQEAAARGGLGPGPPRRPVADDEQRLDRRDDPATWSTRPASPGARCSRADRAAGRSRAARCGHGRR